ncbi:MAG: PIN domain-containing protein [Phycisphaeraceae bacterium]
MKLRVYLDTSVISAAEDGRTPIRQAQTLAFFARANEFELITSELTRQELTETPDPQRRRRLLVRLEPIRTIAIDGDMRALATEYVGQDIVPPEYEDDAIHIAAAVLSRQDALISWNFRHLVNRRRRSLVNLFNSSRGLPIVEILSPPEL